MVSNSLSGRWQRTPGGETGVRRLEVLLVPILAALTALATLAPCTASLAAALLIQVVHVIVGLTATRSGLPRTLLVVLIAIFLIVAITIILIVAIGIRLVVFVRIAITVGAAILICHMDLTVKLLPESAHTQEVPKTFSTLRDFRTGN
jgi:hypothetical protein